MKNIFKRRIKAFTLAKPLPTEHSGGSGQRVKLGYAEISKHQTGLTYMFAVHVQASCLNRGIGMPGIAISKAIAFPLAMLMHALILFGAKDPRATRAANVDQDSKFYQRLMSRYLGDFAKNKKRNKTNQLFRYKKGGANG